MRDDDEKRLLEGDIGRTICLGSVVRLLAADLTKDAARNYAASSFSMLCAYTTIPESVNILTSSGPQEPNQSEANGQLFYD